MMMRSSASAIVIVFLSMTALTRLCFAAHPQLLLDEAELTFVREKVANNASDWKALKHTCDDLTTYAVLWPDAISGGSSTARGYVAGSAKSRGVIATGYNGGRFETALTELGVCYQALKSSTPSEAAAYLRQAHHIIAAIAQPPLTLTRVGDGAIRYALSVDRRGMDLPAGAPLSVFLYRNRVGSFGDASKSVHVGETWTIAGAKGCTAMNGTWRVSALDGNLVSFAQPDASAAPPLNAECSLFTFEVMRDSGYPLRFWIPALAKAYDWFYEGLTLEEKSNLLFCMHAWLYELSVTGLQSGHPEENYAYGDVWAVVAAFVATYGDDETSKPLYENLIAERLFGAHQIRDYRQLWLSGGGFGEGWQAYGYTATRLMMNAVLAMKIHGVDWSQPPYNFNFVDSTLRYWMEFTNPSKLALDENEYVYPVTTTVRGITEPVWIPLGHAAMFCATARRFKSSDARRFQSWYEEIYKNLHAAAGKSVPAWNQGPYATQPDVVDEVLYYDPTAASDDWKTLPLMYRGWSGNYAVSRSDWSNDAVEVTFLGGPSVGAAGNGKTQFNSGSITVRRGDKNLLLYGLSEVARAGDILTPHDYVVLGSERNNYGNKKNSIFWAGADATETRNQGLTSVTPPPGQRRNVTSWRSSIDRVEDVKGYTYWRGAGLEANNAKSSIDSMHHQSAWTREVFFLRPKLVVVHDRTTVLNDKDDRATFWTFGRALTLMASTNGMTRYDAESNGVYRGTFTSVLPASPSTVTLVDHDQMHFLYRIEVRPAVMDHKSDTWLAVLEAANSPREVTPLKRISAHNAEAIELDTSDPEVIAFSSFSPPHLPISIDLSRSERVYVCGLEVSTNYKTSIRENVLTIGSDDGSTQTQSTSAGILEIPPHNVQ